MFGTEIPVGVGWVIVASAFGGLVGSWLLGKRGKVVGGMLVGVVVGLTAAAISAAAGWDPIWGVDEWSILYSGVAGFLASLFVGWFS